MATFQDNIKTIQNAVYGKEMRPAISEALMQGWDAVKIMMKSVDQLNSRVDALSGSDTGGGGTPNLYEDLVPPILFVDGGATSLVAAGNPTI